MTPPAIMKSVENDHFRSSLAIEENEPFDHHLRYRANGRQYLVEVSKRAISIESDGETIEYIRTRDPITYNTADFLLLTGEGSMPLFALRVFQKYYKSPGPEHLSTDMREAVIARVDALTRCLSGYLGRPSCPIRECK